MGSHGIVSDLGEWSCDGGGGGGRHQRQIRAAAVLSKGVEDGKGKLMCLPPPRFHLTRSANRR
jgi:hypothetical protein